MPVFDVVFVFTKETLFKQEVTNLMEILVLLSQRSYWDAIDYLVTSLDKLELYKAALVFEAYFSVQRHIFNVF